MFGEAQLVPALLASQPKFCVEFHFEEPRKELGTIRCKNPHFQGNSSPRNSVVTTGSLAVSGFWKALSGAIQAWVLSHVGSSQGRRLLSYQDEGVRAKYQFSGMWAWNLDNPLQRENVRYICSGLSWEMELERKIRQLCERIKKWNPAELGSVPKLEWCDAFFYELCRVVWMKNKEIRVVSSVVSDMIFLFFCIHLLALRRPKFLLLLQKIQPLQQSVLE